MGPDNIFPHFTMVHNQKRILIVEDNKMDARLLKDILEASGYETWQSSNISDAINLALSNQPDLILMDIQLPGISGLEATRRLRGDELSRRIPIVAVTALAMSWHKREILDSGCDACITKPISIRGFLRTVESILLHPLLPLPSSSTPVSLSRNNTCCSTILSRTSVKVLFLDIDGVVNNKSTKKNHQSVVNVEPVLVARVRRIVQNTGCKVVLSSSWRLFQSSRDEAEKKICKFADITPILRAPRGYEIKAWLTMHPETDHYAILDDADSILPEQRMNFFQTTWENGLTEGIALAVEKHLSKEAINNFEDRISFL
jgi:two-component system, cell cycle response regulator DivK